MVTASFSELPAELHARWVVFCHPTDPKADLDELSGTCENLLRGIAVAEELWGVTRPMLGKHPNFPLIFPSAASEEREKEMEEERVETRLRLIGARAAVAPDQEMTFWGDPYLTAAAVERLARAAPGLHSVLLFPIEFPGAVAALRGFAELTSLTIMESLTAAQFADAVRRQLLPPSLKKLTIFDFENVKNAPQRDGVPVLLAAAFAEAGKPTLPLLESLSLRCDGIDAGVAAGVAAAFPQLQSLALNVEKVFAAPLTPWLAQLSQLTRLVLVNAPRVPARIAEIVACAPTLTSLKFDNSNLCDADLLPLVHGLSALREFAIAGTTGKFEGTILSAFAQAKTPLTSIDLYFLFGLNGAAVMEAVPQFEGLEALRMHTCALGGSTQALDEQWVGALCKKLRHLRRLNLFMTIGFSDAVLDTIASSLPDLEDLTVMPMGSTLTSAGMLHLARLRKLKKLTCYKDTPFDDYMFPDALAALQAALPGLLIDYDCP